MQIVVFGRLVYVGLSRPSEAVAGGLSERPLWPGSIPARPMVGRSGTERAFERVSHALRAGLDIARVVPAALRENRTLIAAVLVLMLSVLSLGVASGGLGVPEAARAVPGQEPGPGPVESEPPPSEAPPSEPPATATPGIETGSPSASGSPAPSGSAAPAPSGSAAPAPSGSAAPSP